MGTHIGWRITAHGNKWRGWARDPAVGRYRSKVMDTRSEAAAWAKQQHALYLAKQDSLGRQEARFPVQAQLRAYLRDMERMGRGEAHRHEVERVLSSLAVKLPEKLDDPVSVEILRAWWSEWDDRSVPTRNRVLGYAQSWQKWCMVEGYCDGTPWQRVRRLRAPAKLKPQWTLDELAVLTCADGDPYHLRWCILLYAGLRVTELHRLEWRDVDLSGRVIHVRSGKGDKDRLVPIQDELAPVLEAYRGSGVIVGRTAAGQTRRTWWRHIRDFASRQGIDPGDRGPHSCRHTYAGLQTATGAPPFVLAEWMGHVDTETTRGYSKLAARYHAVAHHWPQGQFRLRQSFESPPS